MRKKLYTAIFFFTHLILLIFNSKVIAGEIFIFTTPSTSDGKITFSEEARDYIADNNIDYNLDPSVPSPLGNLTGAKVIYKTTKGLLNDGDVLVLSIKNAYFSENLKKCWLIFYENQGIDNDGDGIGDRNYDMNTDGDTLDAVIVAESIYILDTEIYFRVVESNNFPSNGLLYVACAEDMEAPLSSKDSNSMSPISFDEKYNLVINFKKKKPTDIGVRGSEDDNICLGISEAYGCCPETYLDDLITENRCFINFEKQFSLSIHPSLSIINVYPVSLGSVDCSNSKDGISKCYDTSYLPGSEFEDVAGDILTSGSCTDKKASSGWISIENDPDNTIEDYIHLGVDGWKGEFYASLYDVSGIYSCDNDSRGYKGLDFDRMFIDNNGNKDTDTDSDHSIPGIDDILFSKGEECTVDHVDVVESGSPSSAKIVVPHGSVWEDDVYIGVKGTERLKWVKWGLDIGLSIISPDNISVYDYEIDETDDSVISAIKDCCYENDTLPYFLKWEPNGQEAYIPHLLNNGLTYVKVANNSCWDAEIYARVWDEDGDFVDNVYLGVAPAHGATILWGKDIFAKAKALNPDIGGGYGTFSAIITVGAPKRDVEIAAGDSRDGKGKMLPVYDLKGEYKYYRNAEFDEDVFEN